jgi:hypothetical protein
MWNRNVQVINIYMRKEMDGFVVIMTLNVAVQTEQDDLAINI